MSTARIELHWAAQVVAAAADAWLDRRPDDSHTAMRWQSPRMLGEPIGDVVLGLDLPAFAIIAMHGSRVDAFPLAGTTLADAMAWADRQLGTPRGIHLRDYDMPNSAVATGAPFGEHGAALVELVRWYDLGLEVVQAAASPVRIWPHHFDLGAIIELDASRQIGLGLSPGDRYYDEPYFYVTPSPLHDAAFPPLAGGGTWRQDGWVGAVLTASTIGADPRRAHEFMRSALAAARSMLAPRPR